MHRHIFKDFDLNAASEDEQMDAISAAGVWVLKYIDNPSERVQLFATRLWGALRYIKNPTLKAQLNAMRTNGNDIEYIKDPCEEVQLAAIANYIDPLQHIKTPTEKVQLAAVKKDWRSVTYIQNLHSKKVVLTAVLSMIKNNYFDAGIYYGLRHKFQDWPEWDAIDKSLQLKEKIAEAYGMTPAERHDLSNASEEKQLSAIMYDWKNIRYIKNPSEAVQLAAVEEHPVALTDIANPTYSVKLAAVKSFGSSIRFIRGQLDKRLILTAVLTMIKNQEPDYRYLISEIQEEYPDLPEWKAINKSFPGLSNEEY